MLEKIQVHTNYAKLY